MWNVLHRVGHSIWQLGFSITSSSSRSALQLQCFVSTWPSLSSLVGKLLPAVLTPCCS
jgi:hypothetical protein